MIKSYKIKREEMYTLLASYVPDDAEYAADLKDFCKSQIEQINTKREKTRALAAERKAEGDDLRDMVFGALTTEFQSIPQIIQAMGVNDPEITHSKVRARLAQLYRAGEVDKFPYVVKGKRTMHYKLADQNHKYLY